MGIYKVVATLNAESGVPQDAAVNTWHFADSGVTYDDADALSLRGSVEDFYNVGSTGLATGVAGFISQSITRDINGCTFEVYWAATVPPPLSGYGSPRQVASWTLGDPAASTTPYPSEVAIAVSMHADLTGVLEESGTTRPRARRRGRVFLGPLNTGCAILESGTAEVRVHPNVLAHLAERATALLDESTTLGTQLVVVSQTALDWHNVVGGWIDNAFDTMRKRGTDPTTRTLWS